MSTVEPTNTEQSFHKNDTNTVGQQMQGSPLKNETSAKPSSPMKNEDSAKQDDKSTVNKKPQKWILSQDTLKIKSFTGYTLSLPQWQPTSTSSTSESITSTTTEKSLNSPDENKSGESDKKTLSEINSTNISKNKDMLDETKIGDKRKTDYHADPNAKKIAVPPKD
ncbi:hypothetical protein ACO0RG_003144 [Hanseniaspora osmophila]